MSGREDLYVQRGRERKAGRILGALLGMGYREATADQIAEVAEALGYDHVSPEVAALVEAGAAICRRPVPDDPFAGL